MVKFYIHAKKITADKYRDSSTQFTSSEKEMLGNENRSKAENYESIVKNSSAVVGAVAGYGLGKATSGDNTSKIMDLLNKEIRVKEMKELKNNIIKIISKLYGNDNLYNEITEELDRFVKQINSIKKELMNTNIDKHKLDTNYDYIFNKLINGIKQETLQYLFNNKNALNTDNVNINLVNNPEENNNIFLIKYLLNTPSFNENYDNDNDNSSIVNGFKFTILKTLNSNVYAENNIVTKDMYSILDEIGFKNNFTFILYLTNCNYNKNYNLKSSSVFNNKEHKYDFLSAEEGKHLYTLYDTYGNQLLSMKNV